MSLIIEGTVGVTTDLPTGVDQPEGSTVRQLWSGDAYYVLMSGKIASVVPVDTMEFTLYSISPLTEDEIDRIRQLLYQKMLYEQNIWMAEFICFEKPIVEIQVPAQICIPNPFGDPWCFGTGVSGTIVTGYSYKFYAMGMNAGFAQPMAVRPLIPFVAAAAYVAAILTLFALTGMVLLKVFGASGIVTGVFDFLVPSPASMPSPAITSTPGKQPTPPPGFPLLPGGGTTSSGTTQPPVIAQNSPGVPLSKEQQAFQWAALGGGLMLGGVLVSSIGRGGGQQ